MSRMAEGPHGRGRLHRGCTSVTVDLGSRLPPCLLPSVAAAGTSWQPDSYLFFLELRKKDPKKLPKCVSQGFLPSNPCIRFPEPLSSPAGVDSRLIRLVLLASGTGWGVFPSRWLPMATSGQSIRSGDTVLTAQPAPAGAGDLVTH